MERYRKPERVIEQYLCRKVEEVGGLAIKLNPISYAGIPDRLVIMPKSKIYFVELKAPGFKLRGLQKYRAGQLKKLGQSCYCLDSKEAVDEFLKLVNNEI